MHVISFEAQLSEIRDNNSISMQNALAIKNHGNDIQELYFSRDMLISSLEQTLLEAILLELLPNKLETLSAYFFWNCL